jgi:hypothetical protein
MTLISAEVPDPLRKRTWYSQPQAYAFLVDAPLSFAHSQLRITTAKSEPEEVAFANASSHVASCVRVLRTVLPNAIASWESLARYTNTSGPYQKTLILKVSADEKPYEYKFHLVPFFSSHLDSANRLYQATHNQPAGKSGGLLHWVGEREVIVDYDVRDRSDPNTIARLNTFALDDLAMLLRAEAEKAP